MDQIEWLNISDAAFYALAWAFAFASGVARSLYDDMYKSARVSFITGNLSGFVSLAILSVYFSCTSDGLVTQHLNSLGFAVLIGLFAKQHILVIELISSLLPKIVKRYVGKTFGFSSED